jgi:hypothetical protein
MYGMVREGWGWRAWCAGACEDNPYKWVMNTMCAVAMDVSGEFHTSPLDHSTWLHASFQDPVICKHEATWETSVRGPCAGCWSVDGGPPLDRTHGPGVGYCFQGHPPSPTSADPP